MILFNNKYLSKHLEQQYYDILNATDVEILNLGSRASKFDYDFLETGLNSLNVAMCPQSLSYDFRILKQYTSSLKKNAIVNINIMPCSFLVDEYSNWNNHVKYCYILPSKSIYNYKIKMGIKAFLKLFYKNNSGVQLYNGDIVTHAHARVDGWKEEFKLEEMDYVLNDKVLQKCIYYNKSIIERMIDWCKANELRCIITFLPVSEALHALISSELYRELVLKNIGPDATIIDFYNSKDWQKNELYTECDCLKGDIRIKFTNEWYRRICNELK